MNEEIERLVGAVSESEKSVRGEPVQNPKLRYFNPFELFDQTGSVIRPTRSTSKKRKAPEERQKAGMLWVAPVGDRRSYAILARNFFLGGKLNKQKTH